MVKNFPKKAKRKAPDSLPVLGKDVHYPSHPKLRTPKKTDKKALKEIEKGNLLWDKKAVERKARKQALQREAVASGSPRFIAHSQAKNILKSLPKWTWDTRTSAFVSPTGEVTQDDFEQFLEMAKEKLQNKAYIVKIKNVTHEQRIELKKALPARSRVVPVV